MKGLKNKNAPRSVKLGRKINKRIYHTDIIFYDDFGGINELKDP